MSKVRRFLLFLTPVILMVKSVCVFPPSAFQLLGIRCYWVSRVPYCHANWTTFHSFCWRL